MGEMDVMGEISPIINITKTIEIDNDKNIEINMINNNEIENIINEEITELNNIKKNELDLELELEYSNNLQKINSLEEINKLTLKELQNIARKNKIKIKGKKEELLERVKALFNLHNTLNK